VCKDNGCVARPIACGFTIFVKHLESVGGLYENHKAHTKIGQIVSLYTVVFEDTQSTAWIFTSYFQLPYLPEETCFQQAGSCAVEGTSQPLTISKK